jgi:hypothetical protein
MTRSGWRVVVACAAVLGAAVGCRQFDASSYARGCSVDADCVLVDSEPCSECGEADAIARSELDRYESDLEAARRTCVPPRQLGPQADCAAFSGRAACVAGRCAVSSAGSAQGGVDGGP